MCHGHKNTEEPYPGITWCFSQTQRGEALRWGFKVSGLFMWAGEPPSPYFSLSGRGDRTFFLILFPFLSWPPFLDPVSSFPWFIWIRTPWETGKRQRFLHPLPAGKGQTTGLITDRLMIAQISGKRTVAKRTGKRTPIHFGKLAFKPENRSKYKNTNTESLGSLRGCSSQEWHPSLPPLVSSDTPSFIRTWPDP